MTSFRPPLVARVLVALGLVVAPARAGGEAVPPPAAPGTSPPAVVVTPWSAFLM